MCVVHIHTLASDIHSLLGIPSESNLDRAVWEILLFHVDALIDSMHVESSLETTKKELDDKAFLVLDSLASFELYAMVKSDSIVSLKSLIFRVEFVREPAEIDILVCFNKSISVDQ